MYISVRDLVSKLEEIEGVDHVNDFIDDENDEIEIYITNENMDGHTMFEVMSTLMNSSTYDPKLAELDPPVGVCITVSVRGHDL